MKRKVVKKEERKRGFVQGRFQPRNPKKYKGNPSKIVYRSSWELKLFMFLDNKEDVVEWQSEEMFLYYNHPFRGRKAKYFPDVTFKVKDKHGKITSHMWEVKPKAQCKPPKKPKRKTKSHAYAVASYAVNKKKWIAAEEYCADKGISFRLITEDELKIKG